MARHATKSGPKSPTPYSVAYAGSRLGVSVPTVYRLIAEGKLRSAKIGVKGRRIYDAAIDDCIKLLEAEEAARLSPKAAA
jgi:excisionase family DNA binding protein